MGHIMGVSSGRKGVETLFVLLWVPLLAGRLLSSSDVGLSVDDILVDSEVWDWVVLRIVSFMPSPLSLLLVPWGSSLLWSVLLVDLNGGNLIG